ncbi:MAG: GDSL-type esterase/lipase family protein [Chloroflexota bacterium]
MKFRAFIWLAIAAFLIYFVVVLFAMNQNRGLSIISSPNVWESEIEDIEGRYIEGYPQGKIVFIGSSSIRGWNTLAADMVPLDTLNHGFGGSKIHDVAFYADRLIFPFNPRAIVVFVGSNDINGVQGESKSGAETFDAFVEFAEKIHDWDADLPIYYISITPTQARWHVWDDIRDANQLIAGYAAGQSNITFIDMTSYFLDDNREPNAELFLSDGLHLNAKGYAIWTSNIKPILADDFG